MTCYFVADVHLSENRPDITHAFLEFLRCEASGAEALYLLGDLFEFWIGDDDDSELHQQVARQLRRVSERTPVFYVHGNRDFLLGSRFAARAGLRVLPEQSQITLFDHIVLVSHGDEWCTEDRAYQRFRHWVRQPWLQRVFKLLPLKWRLNIARKMRAQSREQQQGKSSEMMDVNPGAVEATLEHHRAVLAIHGHTHRPAIHAGPVPRLVVGDWYTQGSVLIADRDGFCLQARQLDDWRTVTAQQNISWEELGAGGLKPEG